MCYSFGKVFYHTIFKQYQRVLPMLLDDPTAPHRDDLKKSIFEITEVTEDICTLTESQKFILNYFKTKTEGKRLVCRADLNPVEMVKYIPNIALFDLEYDEQGNLSDIISRLLGTAISDFYGELTGISVFSDRVKDASPDLPDRLLAQVQAAIKHRNAITTVASASFENSTDIRILTLVLPMSHNNSDLDKIFMYLEVASSH